MPPSYYDIDHILSEDEMLPCTTLFDFHHLAHLDPDFAHLSHSIDEEDDGRRRKIPDKKQWMLPAKSRIQMPLWGVEKWSMMGFVRMGLPRHFRRNARERLLADSGTADLRSRNERYFLSGIKLIDLIERSTKKQMSEMARTNNRSSRLQLAVTELKHEADELRQTLLLTFTGERLRRTLDWTLTSIDDDVYSFTSRLTELELRLFYNGASAVSAHHSWKMNGSRKIPVSRAVLATRGAQVKPVEVNKDAGERFNNKRAKVSV